MTKKYALIHEWLTPKATGGSELVVKEILQHIEADLYALIDFESTNPKSYLYQRKIGTTFLQKFPLAENGVQKYLPLLPLAIEQLDLTEYDVILSSSHAVAKGIIVSPHQLHICYCHTPMRYAWDLTFEYLQNSKLGTGLPGIFTRYLLHQIRQWDVISANRVDYFIANSQHTARRIEKCYRRPAKVIYPPVNIERFTYTEQKKDYYLIVSRLVSYKQVTLIVKAFNHIGKELIVIGSGPEQKILEKIAKPNIKILGAQPDHIVAKYMSAAKAFLFAGCEDFGIVLVEAQGCGTPIIAYKRGGAVETVKDIREHPHTGTGIFFHQQTETAIIEAVETFEQLQKTFNPEMILKNAQFYSPQRFAHEYLNFVQECQ
jgi:glycosyltransferase involved in cell wall biosynthesis